MAHGKGKWQQRMAMENGRICLANEALDVGEWQEAEGPMAGICEVISQRRVTNTVVNVALVHPLGKCPQRLL